MAKFEIEDIVCLTFDNSKRFIVTSTVSLMKEPDVAVAYFNECKGKNDYTVIPEKYLVKISHLETCKTDDNGE